MSVDKDSIEENTVKSQQILQRFQSSYPCLFMDFDGCHNKSNLDQPSSSYLDDHVEEWLLSEGNHHIEINSVKLAD